MADVFTEAEGLRRRRALLEALQGQNLNTPIVGDTGLGQALAQVATSLLGRYQDKKLRGEESTNREAYGKELGQGVERYLRTMEGVPGQTMDTAQASNLMQNNVVPPLAEPVQSDPRRAIAEAMASRIPELQAIGGTGLKEHLAQLRKTEETFSNPVTEKDASGAPISVQYGNRGTRRPVQGSVPFERPLVVNNKVVETTKPTQVLADYEEKFGEPVLKKGADGQYDLYQKNLSTGQFKKMDNAPKTVIHNMVKAQNLGFGEWAKQAVQEVVGMSKTARESAALARQLDQLGSLTAGGTFTGPMADAATWLGQLTNSLGMKIDPAKLQNSETYNSVATDAWQRMVSQYGGNRGVTVNEAEKIKEIVPQLKNSPEARVQMTAVLKAIAQRNVDDAARANTELAAALQSENAGKFTFGLSSATMPNPAISVPQPPAKGKGVTNKYGEPVKIRGF